MKGTPPEPAGYEGGEKRMVTGLVIPFACCCACAGVGLWIGLGIRKVRVREAKKAMDRAEFKADVWREQCNLTRGKSNVYEDALREIEERAHAARCKVAYGDRVSSSGQ